MKTKVGTQNKVTIVSYYEQKQKRITRDNKLTMRSGKQLNLSFRKNNV